MAALPVTIERLLARIPARVSIVLRDLERDWALSYAADTPVTAASVIKLVIIGALYRAFVAGTCRPQDTVVVTPEGVVPGSGVLRWLATPLALSLRDLAVLTVIVSDNTAANLLIEHLGFATIETFVREHGLSSTALRRRFAGRAALPGEPENSTSAHDMAEFLAQLEGGHVIPEGPLLEDVRTILRAQQFRDIIPARLPSEVRIGNKTGSLPGILHDAALLWAPHGRAALVLLSWDGGDPETVRRGLADLARALYDTWAENARRIDQRGSQS